MINPFTSRWQTACAMKFSLECIKMTIAFQAIVNTNTAVKAYDELARANIIYNKRGLGYFVTAGAREAILQQRRQSFMNEQLPELFRQMKLLGIKKEEVCNLFDSYNV